MKRNSTCFVCQIPVKEDYYSINNELMLPVCFECRDTEKEKKAVDEYNESLADGFICGCI